MGHIFGWAYQFENQRRADKRIPILLQIPAAVRFVSAEPMLGPVDLTPWFPWDRHRKGLPGWGKNPDYKQGLHWIICGGESGSGARPMHPDWVRNLRDQCQDAGVPFFFESWGDWAPFYDRNKDDPDWKNVPTEKHNVIRINSKGNHGFHGDRIIYARKVGKQAAGRLLDGREWNEMPGVNTTIT